MPTKRRRESTTGIYHVMVKGINNEKIFNQSREKTYFKAIILKHLKEQKVEIYSYCFMSNHAHFIIGADIQLLASFMASILSEYAMYYNYKHHRNGHVFQNRYRSECINDERYFWTCIRYIHLNPVKANMIKYPERYKYSSMSEYLSGEPELIHAKAVSLYQKRFPDADAFREFHKQREIAAILDTEEDLTWQQRDMAVLIAEDLGHEKELPFLNQVFEEKQIQEEYIDRLREILGVSRQKAGRLCTAARQEMEEK